MKFVSLNIEIPQNGKGIVSEQSKALENNKGCRLRWARRLLGLSQNKGIIPIGPDGPRASGRIGKSAPKAFVERSGHHSV
jgi:hypothetical protein